MLAAGLCEGYSVLICRILSFPEFLTQSKNDLDMLDKTFFFKKRRIDIYYLLKSN